MSAIQAPSAPSSRVSLDATDWDAYYQRPYKTASITRKITGSLLVKKMRQFAVRRPSIAELGGANSCFFNLIQSQVQPSEYHIVDNNRFGMDRFHQRIGNVPNVYLHHQDVNSISMETRVDLSFSVGLIEHFDCSGTEQAIAAHFEILKPQGIAIMTFPTPTLLYRAVRSLAESLQMWIFHDERPLKLEEVARAGKQHGELLDVTLNWPIMLTQYVLVFQR